MPPYSPETIASWIPGARWANAELMGERLTQDVIHSMTDLSAASPTSVAAFFSSAYRRDLLSARPGMLITATPFIEAIRGENLPHWRETALLDCPDPYLGFALCSRAFARGQAWAHADPNPGAKASQIACTSIVDPGVVLGEGVQVRDHCVLEAGVKLGARSVLYPGVVLGEGVTVGEDCVLYPHVVLYPRVRLGNRVRIHAGCVLGGDGFGYAPVRFLPSRGETRRARVEAHQKIFHSGAVVVGDDVEIGALTTVDRGTLDDTVIGDSVKIDNHVIVGHNVHVGEGAILCGGVGLAGSARVGALAYLGGFAGVGNRVHVGERAQVGGMTLVSKDVPPGETVLGNPQRSKREHWRVQALLNRLLKKHSERS